MPSVWGFSHLAATFVAAAFAGWAAGRDKATAADTGPGQGGGGTAPPPRDAGGRGGGGERGADEAAKGGAGGQQGQKQQHLPEPGRKGGRRPRGENTPPIDMAAYHQRLVALEVMYVGWGYHGFASQADTEETVEGYLLRALERVRLVAAGAEPSSFAYSRCGRTDIGVSALGQVISLRVRSKRRAGAPPIDDADEIDYVKIINRALPDEIRVLRWGNVPDGFTARFSCTFREYKYFFLQAGDLNIAAMREAAAKLVGEHDFRNFCKMDAANVHNYRRAIDFFHLEPARGDGDAQRTATEVDPQTWVMYLRGSAFLWHQVRCMAAVLFMVGRGLEPPEIVDRLLDVDAVPRKPQYSWADEGPLVLYRCGFDGEHGVSWEPAPEGPSALVDHLQLGLLHGALMRSAVMRCLADPPSLRGARGGGGGGEAGRGRHQPLLQRQREESYDERVAAAKRKAEGGGGTGGGGRAGEGKKKSKKAGAHCSLII